MSNEEAAYLAGLIDGEGTITLTRKAKKEKRSLMISIANTELPLLEYPMAVIGAGTITSKRTVDVRHTPSYAYRVSGRQALSVLQQVFKFLKSYKKERAELVLQEYVRLTPRNGRYNAETQKERERFVERFFALKSNRHSPEEPCL